MLTPYAVRRLKSNYVIVLLVIISSIIVTLNTFDQDNQIAIIPTIINQLINSNKLELGNINTYRDLNFIEDTIEAFIKILKCNKKIYGETINIGSGFNFSINKIAKLLINISGKKAIIKKQKIRIRPIKSEVNFLLADNSKIKKLVGWKPKYNNYNKIKIALTITYNGLKIIRININLRENTLNKSGFLRIGLLIQ